MEDLKQRVDSVLNMLQTYEDDTPNFVFGARMCDASNLIKELEEREAKLLEAIDETIENNLHLADGDNCTLLPLVRVLKQLGIANKGEV